MSVAGIWFVFSGVITLIWCVFSNNGRIKISKEKLKYILPYGILATTLQYALTYIGLLRSDCSKVAVYDQLYVFLIVLSGGLFFKNGRLTIKKNFGCVLGFLGVLAENTEASGFTFKLLGERLMVLATLLQTISYFVSKSS